MKCARCGGKILKSSDGSSCVNCGHTVNEEERVYVRAVDPIIPQKVNLPLSWTR